MYSIGEFSRITSISVKAVRLYQAEGLLEPEFVDEESKYRYFGERSVERALAVRTLRELDFSLQEIRNILEDCGSDDDLSSHLEMKMKQIESRILELDGKKRRIASILKEIGSESQKEKQGVILEEVPEILVASVRF